MVQFARWGQEVCCKVKHTSFVAIDKVLEKAWNLNHEESQLRKVTWNHIRHLNWYVGWD